MGGGLTLMAYALMLVLFLCELQSFLRKSYESSLELGHKDGPLMQINFDIDMHDIECRNLNIVVIDETRQEPIKSLSKQYRLTHLGTDGHQRGLHRMLLGADEDDAKNGHTPNIADFLKAMNQNGGQRYPGYPGYQSYGYMGGYRPPYAGPPPMVGTADDEEKLREKRHKDLEATDGEKELDADWASSDDGFRHKSFEHVVQFHDFTLINFFAGWCSHCRQFAPMWNEIASEIREKRKGYFLDGDGKEQDVWPIKVNCVDFKDLCRQVGIDAFPTLRLYKADGTFSLYSKVRSKEGILSWAQGIVKREHHEWKAHHEETELGCNAKGYLRVPRVPGHLELMAGAGDQNLEPTMTNVSHLVRHLSFTDPELGEKPRAWDSWGKFPGWAFMPIVGKLDGKQFCTQAPHETYEHHLRVVSISAAKSMTTSYMFSHYGRTAKLDTSVIPQARFYFDLEPFAISVRPEEKEWYEFATSMLAILGGVFVLMRLVTLGILAAFPDIERRIGGPKSNGIIG